MTKRKKLVCLTIAALLTVIGCWAELFPAIAEESKHSLVVHTTIGGGGTSDAGGTVSGAGEYKAGDTVTLTATPKEGYCSVVWGSYDVSGLPNLPYDPQFTVSFTMPAKLTQVTAEFKAHFYTSGDLGNGKHIDTCMFCGKTNGLAANHVDANKDDCCDECGYDWHKHTYSKWINDGQTHYRNCETCGSERLDEAKHKYDMNYTASNHWGICTCGATTAVEDHDPDKVCKTCGYRPNNSKFTLTLDYDRDSTEDELKKIEFAEYAEVNLAEHLISSKKTIDGKVYKLVGFCDEDGKEVTSVVLRKNRTVYGIWEEDVWMIVGFRLVGGKFEDGPKVLNCGSMTNEALIEYCNEHYIPTKEGKTFKAWEIDTAYYRGQEDGGITLKAIWE